VQPELFPINELRNIAIAEVETTHYVFTDIDFWPSENMHSILHRSEFREPLAVDWRQAIVVPAFERIGVECNPSRWNKDDCGSFYHSLLFKSAMPRNQKDLVKLIRDRKADVFDRNFEAAHGSTDSEAWLEQGDSLREMQCIQSNR
jgi:hypothetical protein